MGTSERGARRVEQVLKGPHAPWPENVDGATVASFGAEWSRFDQSEGTFSGQGREEFFNRYFAVFPWSELPADSIGADVGCGSGRWAAMVAPRVGKLYAIDPSPDALAVARKNLATFSNVAVVEASANTMPIDDASLDFAYSLGVLHHVPDSVAALCAIAAKLKRGGLVLVYIYYSLDNRNEAYRRMWRLSDLARRLISRAPRRMQALVCGAIACCIYWPLARSARLLDRMDILPASWPLALYRSQSLYVLRTDAYDRFCSPLEKRFSRAEIEDMLRDAGFRGIEFSPFEPYWCAVGRKV